MTIAYIGLGSNLNDPQSQVSNAIAELRQLSSSTLLCVSSLYRSAPLGLQQQPDYINAVVAIKTTLKPHCLMQQLHIIEARHGRTRDGQRWQPRNLDLDLLLYGQLTVNDALKVPHPGIYERDFVILPLAEIAKDLILPDGQSILTLKERCPDRGIKRLI